MSAPWWSLHTHSRFSANDALPSVPGVVERAAALGYPALGLTDHGSVGGVVQLYTACRKAGIEPLPGVELYVTADAERRQRRNYHLTVAAYDPDGYRSLAAMVTTTAQRFHYKPRLDTADLADLADAGLTKGLVVSSGCYFGLVTQLLVERGERPARQVLGALASWFPRTYVELQNHAIVHDDGTTDDQLVDALDDLAARMGLPVLIAQDSHYLVPEDKPVHEALKTLVSFSDDPSEAVFPGDGFHMVDRDYLAGYFEPDVLSRACDNLAELAQAACVRIPEMETFTLKVPDVSVTGAPGAELAERCTKALEELVADIAKRRHKGYRDRLAAELAVIDKAGMAGMLLLVALVTDFMTSKGIWFHARGSASSSLVLYLLGVTQIDPLVWGLRLDRFLSPDRTRPPDVDLDVEHLRRDEVQEFLTSRFAVVQVGNLMQYKLTAEGAEGSSKGSLLVRYFSTQGKLGRKGLTWADVDHEDRAMLHDIARRRLVSGYGTHAAGYVVAPSPDLLSQLPLTWIASGEPHFVTAYGKKDVEKLGFVKLDLLGLRTLSALRITCDLLGMSQRDYCDIPTKDAAVFRRISKRDNDGVFQLEGTAMDYGCARMQPRNVEDLAAALALFRPAIFANGADKLFLRRREGKEKAPDRHADILAVTGETAGILLYQEQIIALLRLAGMDAAELTDTLDAVKASNDNTEAAKAFLEQVKPRIRELTQARGWSAADVDWLADGLLGYADYSFNKSHAAAYAVVAYRSAWLAHHHPLEFWTGMLEAYRDTPKANAYLSAARAAGIKVRPAHVNKSAVGYTIDPRLRCIRKGLVSVKGIGIPTAEEIVRHAPYTSLADLGRKVLPRRVSGARAAALGKDSRECGGAIKALSDAGALEDLEPRRKR